MTLTKIVTPFLPLRKCHYLHKWRILEKNTLDTVPTHFKYTQNSDISKKSHTLTKMCLLWVGTVLIFFLKNCVIHRDSQVRKNFTQISDWSEFSVIVEKITEIIFNLIGNVYDNMSGARIYGFPISGQIITIFSRWNQEFAVWYFKFF